MKRGEVTNHKALWVKEELISTLHEFKCEPRGTTRGVADRRVQPVLSPFEYFHQIIRDEMREEIVKSTKCLPTRYAGQRPPSRGYPVGREWAPGWAKASKEH